jgi:hypothetical protein
MFRFTIRELLLLTVIVGLAVAWWVDRHRQHDHWAQQVNSANQQVQRFDRQLRIYQDGDHLMRVYRIVRGQNQRFFGTPIPDEY